MRVPIDAEARLTQLTKGKSGRLGESEKQRANIGAIRPAGAVRNFSAGEEPLAARAAEANTITRRQAGAARGHSGASLTLMGRPIAAAQFQSLVQGAGAALA